MEATIEKAFISFRIGVHLWVNDNRFEELIQLFETYKGVTDEVTFFTSETHPPLPLKVIEERAKILAERMSEVREFGYKTGINILSTIGHHNENLPNSLSDEYTRMTDLDGNVCHGSFCPNDEGMRGYIKRLYQIITLTNPDYIWIDDDVRLFGHMPIACGCFCDNCLGIFEKEYTIKYTRSELRNAFNNGSAESKLDIRRKWLEHNRNTMARLFELIEKSVHDLKPNIPIGFMTGDRFFEGYDFDKWAEILSGKSKAEVLWRPGGGNYTDTVLDGIAGKSHDIGRQIAFLPKSVVSIQSELENFTYERLKKSAHATALEAASHIASGCTGTAFNVLSMYEEPLDEYVPLVAELRKVRPFLDLLAKNIKRVEPIGLYTGWVKDSFIVKNIHGGDWFSGADCVTAHANVILSTGIPAAYSIHNAKVTVLCSDGVVALKDHEIEKILSSGVYMDAQALKRLNEMGYGDLTGFDVDDGITHDCIEQLVEHSINGSFAGRNRDCRQSFWRDIANILIKRDEKAEILARLVDYTYQEIAPCSMGVYENRFGGRICVAGYYPWDNLQNLSKSSQIKSLMRWLSKDSLPAYVNSYHRINLWVRESEKGKLIVALTNSYLDPAIDLKLNLLTDREEISIFDMDCSETKVKSDLTDGVYKQFILPEIKPWHMVLILA